MMLIIPALIVTVIVYALSTALVYHFNDTWGQVDERFNVDDKRLWVYVAPLKAAVFVFLAGFRIVSYPPTRPPALASVLNQPRRLSYDGAASHATEVHMPHISCASIVTAFDDQTIGTKVTDAPKFLEGLAAAIETTDFQDQRVPGQALIPLPDLLDTVSAGVGEHTQEPSDYVVRLYRGKVRLYLRRELASPVESLSAVVYTKDAYLSDPDVQQNPEEVARIENEGTTHVLVAVLAGAGPKSPLTPGRLVHNLAGGNREALEWDADEIRAKAQESLEYYNEWGTVAD